MMKSYNLAVEFDTQSDQLSPPALCMLSFSIPDDVDELDVAAMFRNELFAVITLARSTQRNTPASTAVLKAAKAVQNHFHCESFMLEANNKLSIHLV